MSIVRSKVSQNFTIVNNSVINDTEFDSKYMGTYLRLISKGEGWEISAHGLASLYPTNGIDFYRNAFKHMCKLGYLIRIPQPRVKGQYQKVVMELYDTRQIESNLSDEDVEKLFSKEELSTEEIQKIYPKRVFRYGEAEEVNPTQQRTDKTSSSKKKETTTKTIPKTKEVVVLSKDKEKVPIPIIESLKRLDLTPSEEKRISKDFTQSEIDIAVERVLTWSTRKSDISAILHCLKNADTWKDKVSQESVVVKNTEYLDSKKHLNGKNFAETKIWVCKNHIEFVPNANCPSIVLSVESPTFIESVKNYFKKLEDFCGACLA
jgi:hypothetical protein